MSVEKNIQLNRSSRRVLLVALVIIAAVGLYRWILSPYNGQLLAAQQYESTLDSAIRKTNFLDATMEAKRKKIEELGKKSDRLRDELFTTDEVRSFFASLPSVGTQSGCVIQSVSSVQEERSGSRNQTSDGSWIVRKRALVAVVGRYNDIVRFIDKLQKSQRKCWIDSVRVDVGGGAGKLKCEALLTIYCVERMEMAFYE